jgi:hypothetical protein
MTMISKAKCALRLAAKHYDKLNFMLLLSKIALCISRGAIIPDLTRNNGRLSTISP